MLFLSCVKFDQEDYRQQYFDVEDQRAATVKCAKWRSRW